MHLIHLVFPPHMQVFSMAQKSITLKDYGLLKIPFFGTSSSPAFSSLSPQQKCQLYELSQIQNLSHEQFFNKLIEFKIAHIRPIAASAPGALQVSSCLSSSLASSSALSAPQGIEEAAAGQEPENGSQAVAGAVVAASAELSSSSQRIEEAAAAPAPANNSEIPHVSHAVGDALVASAPSQDLAQSAPSSKPNALQGIEGAAAGQAPANNPEILPVSHAVGDTLVAPQNFAQSALSSKPKRAAKPKRNVWAKSGRSRWSTKRSRPTTDTPAKQPRPVLGKGARADFQIECGLGSANPIFDQVPYFYLQVSCIQNLFHIDTELQNKDCFKNSIALLLIDENASTSSKLRIPNLQLNEIHCIMNQGGHFLRELPLYFSDNQHRRFKPEMPLLLGHFLEHHFEVNLPWLTNSELNPSEVSRVQERVRHISDFLPRGMLPYLLLTPFNRDGVAMHCVGLDCRFKRATVLDPANVNSYEFTLENLHAACDGKWTPSFHRIWCICSRS